MKVIDLAQEPIDLLHALEQAKDGPLILIGPDGQEYVLAEADDFEGEIAQLRTSPAFPAFLDSRLASRHRRRPVSEVLREVEAELASGHPTNDT